MIERYSTKEMRQIWSLENKFAIWRDIEIYVSEYWAEQGKITAEELQEIKQKATFSVERILEIEKEVNHDVIAFLTNLAENIGKPARHVHYGLTSSDVVDTAFSIQILQAHNLIDIAYKKLLKTLYQKAREYGDLPVVGRTHGVHAEPTTLGLKFLSHYMELYRCYQRLKKAAEELAVGKISGAVGTYSQIPMALEAYVLKKLNLEVDLVSTQVIARDRHAHYLQQLALSAMSLAHLAQEIRLLQKTESRELEEPFLKGQKGSSAMPHKRNPILCERICGLARVIAGYAETALQNIMLWHERDISHSSAERIIFPDATSLFEYMLLKMDFIMQNIIVYPENANKILEKTKGLLFSSRALLFITEKLKVSREKAYEIVQTEAMKVWENIDKENLKERLKNRDELKEISEEEWQEVFDLKSFLQNVPKIFERVPFPLD